MSNTFITTDDGVRLYSEETGSGIPIIFVHEFGGDFRSWEPQVRHFSRQYRCIAYNARGYPPSDVPEDPRKYSQKRACDDVLCVLDGLRVEKAHVVGLSMGSFAALHFGLHYPDRALSLLIAGCGYGAEPDQRERFRSEADAIAAELQEKGMEAFAQRYAVGPARVQFQNKDPRGWKEFAETLATHSATGSALTQQAVQKERRSLFEMQDELKQLTVPMLIVAGDEDWPCLIPNIFLKRVVSSAALVVMPNSGHTVNLEEPCLFNMLLANFICQVDAGRWPRRDPRTTTTSISGID